jgi:hypothetical protein
VTCERCGEPIFADDRFCGNCGVLQTSPGTSEKTQSKRRAPSAGAPPRGRGRGLAFKLAFGLIFWGSVLGLCYLVFANLAKDIPWSSVEAVVRGRKNDAGTVAPGGVENLPPIAPDEPPADEEETIPAGPPEWGERDANGYSVLVTSGGGAHDGLSMRGTVKGNRVRLRAEPNTQSQILGHFETGNEIAVTERYWSGREKFHWFKVASADNSGWMYGEYLRVTED